MATATRPAPPSTVATPSVTPDPVPASMPGPPSGPTLYRMSYDLYERIVDHGLLGPRDRVVLLDGLLVNQMGIGARHTASVALGQLAFQRAAPAGWYVRAEQPVVLRGGPRGDSSPQPDLALAIGSILTYVDRHPIAAEIGLIAEVASDPDAVRIDRAGLARYAHAGIPIACIVNIPDRSIEVHTEPTGPTADPRYRRSETLRAGQSLVGEIGNATTGPAAIAPIPVEAFFAPE